jgi:hypothetical protein
VRPAYREKLNAEFPHYRAIHARRIDHATRQLIMRHALEYDELLHADERGSKWARAELRRRHNAEWRRILSRVPGTLRDVKLGLTIAEFTALVGGDDDDA